MQAFTADYSGTNNTSADSVVKIPLVSGPGSSGLSAREMDKAMRNQFTRQM